MTFPDFGKGILVLILTGWAFAPFGIWKIGEILIWFFSKLHWE